MHRCTLAALLAAATIAATATEASADGNRAARRHAATMPWHGGYYNYEYGQPLALVVPPTATTRVSWGWGVTQSEVNPIYHQFKRIYPGCGGGGDFSQFRPTPYWPSHTDQFGVYYIRGPWGHY